MIRDSISWKQEKMTGLDQLNKEELIELVNRNFSHRCRLSKQLTEIMFYLDDKKIMPMEMFNAITENCILTNQQIQ